MNLLLFVLSFLLLVASISYQGLAHYRTNAELRRVFDNYIRVEEPCNFNSLVENTYKRIKRSNGKALTKKAADEEEQKEEKDSGGSSGINYNFLTDPAYPTTYPIETELFDNLIKRLIVLIYGDQPFFQAIQAARSNVLAELLPAIRAAAEDPPITSKEKLKTLVLQDPQLEELWGQLKRTNPVSERVLQLFTNQTALELNKEEELPCYQISLFDYLKQSKVQKIRLYLASRALLLALLDDPNQVEDIILKRYELYKAVKKNSGALSASDATTEFQQFAEKFPGLQNFQAIISYTVTKTNPKDYE